MSMTTDPIADMLTRIRNSNAVNHETVDIPSSKMKKNLAKILLDEGFVSNVDFIEDEFQGVLRLTLKYANDKKVISGLKRISKPGLRIYAKKDEVPKVLGGLGIAVISTSSGLLVDRKARELGVGGEVICYVW
ncbi:30S ribosomal protein S8 [Clostridiaceae bacterium HSG29]|nr:30S ribosomal protein S8 [Clostridiaceae bacterium HSG29]